ncbi:MAG: hypothetical protein VX498_12320 [Myxococcota bacterium]|nr:hypothetical protein [Myxococcota bacterium]
MSPGTDVISLVGGELPDLARDGLPRLRPKEIALMFSGGVDSTATAVMLAERYERVHLVCYRNGYGHYYHHRTEARVHELNRRLGDRFIFSLIGVKEHFDRILVDRVLKDYKAYRSGFIWFMGCKMAMHLRSVIYCLEHGLPVSTDGSNSDTDEMVEQSLLSLSLIQHFYEDNAVEFGTPVYEVRRAESRQVIKDLGLKMGVQVMDRHLCIQPTCVAGELYYLPYLFFNKPVKHDEETVSRFIEEKVAICRALMQEYFAEKGVDLDALLADRREQLAKLQAGKED